MQTEAVWRAIAGEKYGRCLRRRICTICRKFACAAGQPLTFKKRESTVFSGEGGGVSPAADEKGMRHFHGGSA